MPRKPRPITRCREPIAWAESDGPQVVIQHAAFDATQCLALAAWLRRASEWLRVQEALAKEPTDG